MLQFSLRQTMEILTTFAIAFGLLHEDRYEATIAAIVAIGISAIILTNRHCYWLIARGVGSVAFGFLAASIYVSKWGDAATDIKIVTAVAAALICWTLSAFVQRKILNPTT